MCEKSTSFFSLDTLAHPRKSDIENGCAHHSQKKGSPNKKGDKSKQLTTLQKRARSKWYTKQIVGKLIDTVSDDSILKKYYRHSLLCCSVMQQRGEYITTKYCNSRCCNVCNRIRTGKLMNAYIVQMQKFEHIEFITLTIPNMTADKLSLSIKEMNKAWNQIVDMMRKKGKNISGIRKTEITYNQKEDTYHPHFHILTDYADGEYIIEQWLKRFPTANRKGQDTTTANEGSLNEIFKYSTKVLYKASGKKGTFEIFAPAINTILLTLYGKRTFQTFGNVKKESEDLTELDAQIYEGVEPIEAGEWIWRGCDWYLSTGTDINMKIRLTNYEAPEIEFYLIE